eukprot:CAMPEP_0204181024 /NCGR_PEP_ID=MMETSP0361-20130328/51527_1 /ASSEMBLY_ACC=CAM_ASM_000343 /TAXON_ID=268821 /ORGANISM="Scrippsiella Hangoei, Strain SHTV-5" /LENGTH=355 /DNA_ID=CAMNT_0051140537 /DNA_START=15 /DNA_END=1079 /DNA_ORIENTATION=+
MSFLRMLRVLACGAAATLLVLTASSAIVEGSTFVIDTNAGAAFLGIPLKAGRVDYEAVLQILSNSEIAPALLKGPLFVSDSSSDEVGAHIPKRIVQTLNRKIDLPSPIAGALRAWQALNPEYSHELHDRADMRRLIEQEFDPSFLEIFDSLGQYQQQSDLWRLCYLFLSGGVYIDADYAPLSPLREFLPTQADLVLALCAPVIVDPLQPPPGCHSRPEALKRLQNGFIAVVPRHPVLFLALQRIRWNYYRKEDQHYLLALGPALLYDAYSSLLGDPLLGVLRGAREHGVLLGADVVPFIVARHRPEVELLLDCDGVIASASGTIPVGRLLHKYPGWAESIEILRDDNSTHMSHGG